jgi:hypothetical protein
MERSEIGARAILFTIFTIDFVVNTTTRATDPPP